MWGLSLMLSAFTSIQKDPHRRIFDTAGKGYSTALPAGIGISAVKVDIEVPVIRPMSTTARPLQRETLLDWAEHPAKNHIFQEH